jgi:hypothetical protein
MGGTAPFTLRLGALAAADGGVFALVEDPSGRLETLRQRLLRPPQRSLGYPFHTTVAHPRTAASPGECWEHLRGRHLTGEVAVEELLWTATDDTRRTVLARLPLTAAGG